MHAGMTSGMTCNGPLLLKQIYALLEFMCSVVKQTEKAAVEERCGLKRTLNASPNSCSVMTIPLSPPCCYESSFVPWLKLSAIYMA